jgi:hypothetical protein
LKTVPVSALPSASDDALLDSASASVAAFFRTFASGAMLAVLLDTMVLGAQEEGGRFG